MKFGIPSQNYLV